MDKIKSGSKPLRATITASSRPAEPNDSQVSSSRSDMYAPPRSLSWQHMGRAGGSRRPGNEPVGRAETAPPTTLSLMRGFALSTNVDTVHPASAADQTPGG